MICITSEVPTINISTGYKAAMTLSSLPNPANSPKNNNRPNPMDPSAIITPINFRYINIKIIVTNITEINPMISISHIFISTSSS